MEILFYLIIFSFGLAVGSFLNCVIYRLQEDEEFLIKRSYCPHCKHILGWQDLIPVLSFALLRGKCRYCKKPISWQYPLVELTTGFLFAFVAQNQITANSGQLTAFGLFSLGYLLTVICFLIIIFVSDLRYYIIPDKIIYPTIIVSAIYILLSFSISHWDLIRNWELGIRNFDSLLNPLISAVLASSFFLSIILISRGRWMGWGDVKFAFFMGLLLGFPNILLALFLAFFFGAIIGIGLIAARKKSLKSEVPFGPFLAIGTFFSLFWGEKIIQWYLHLFF